MALAPFDTYTAAAVAYVIVIGFLVSVLLIGALLVLNLTFMTRRQEDLVGGRSPSDVGFLKQQVWPQAPYRKKELPAEEEDYVEEEGRTGRGDTPKAA